MPRTPEQFEKIRERTKRQILDAGLIVFATKGYNGASVADIAKQAGVSKGLAYNYFPSKLELAKAVLYEIENVFTEFENIFDKEQDPYKLIQLSIKSAINNVIKNEEFWRLYITFFSQPEVSNIAKEVFGKFVEKYINRLQKIFTQIGIKNPKAEAYILAGILDGIPLDYIFYKDKYPIKSVLKQLLKKYSREELDKLR